MALKIATMLFVAAISEPNAGFFGDVDRRHPADVAADLSSVQQLSDRVFSEIADSVLVVMETARPQALRIRAMDVLCARGGAEATERLAEYLNAALDQIDADPHLHLEDTLTRHLDFSSFATSDPSKWSPAMRGSNAVQSVLSRVATKPGRILDQSVYHLTVDTLVDLAMTEADARRKLVEIIGTRGPGAARAAARLVELPVLDDASDLLRISAQHPFNRYAIDVLAHFGNQQIVPIIQEHLSDMGPELDPSDSWFLAYSTKRIEWQHPPSKLLDIWRMTDSDMPDRSLRSWSLKRAVQLGLDLEEIRLLVLDWAQSANPYELGGFKESALSLGILRPADLPDAPPNVARVFGHVAKPERRHGPVPIPDRRVRAVLWKPNAANYDVLNAWFAEQDWAHIPDDEGLRLIRQKACELDLLSPDLCESYAAPPP